LRSVHQPEPAARGGPYLVAEKIAGLPLPGYPVNLLVHGRALYVFMNMTGWRSTTSVNPPRRR